MTHTPARSLRPDTVIPGSFKVTSGGKKVEVSETVYDPYDNSLKLVLEEGIANCEVSYSSDGILACDGSTADIFGKGCAYEELEANTDGLSIIGISYLSDGVPTDNFINLINAEIKLVIANSSASSYEGVRASLNASDGSLITYEETDLAPYQTREVWLRVSGYLFRNNDFYISLG